MKVLIGSKALSTYFPEVTVRDTDYFTDEKTPGAETFYHPKLEEWEWSGPVASVDELYTIKVSHSFWKLRKWKKHMSDIMFLQEKGATFLPGLYAILYVVWEETHGVKKANLEATPEDFFNANITRVYEHDSIHAAVAYGSEPLFNKILRDGSEVAVSKKKFEALPHEMKLNLVREEVFATALERQVISAGGNQWRSSYAWALCELVTSYSKGWFPLFVVLNFSDLHKAPFNYYEKMLANEDRLVKL